MSETWRVLAEGHRRAAVSGHGVVPEHHPIAAVVACSDARVPPSRIFDQPPGALFVVREAGNTATESALASLDYAVGELGVDLIVVVGHTSCGAVGAAAGGACGGHLGPVIDPIAEVVAANPEASPDELSALNVANTARHLATHDGPVGDAIRSGTVEVRGAVFDLRDGSLVAVDDHPDVA